MERLHREDPAADNDSDTAGGDRRIWRDSAIDNYRKALMSCAVKLQGRVLYGVSAAHKGCRGSPNWFLSVQLAVVGNDPQFKEPSPS